MAGLIEKNDVITADALEQLKESLTTLKDMATEISNIKKSGGSLGGALKGAGQSNENISKLSFLTKELETQLQKLGKAQAANAAATSYQNKETIKENIERKKKIAVIKEEITGEKALAEAKRKNAAIDRQKAEMSKLLIQARNTEVGSLSRLNAVNNIYKQRMKELNVLIPAQAAQYQRLNQSIANNNQRMVQMAGAATHGGKQFNMLQWQIMQVSRELPAFAYGINVGIGALSNNLPMLVDEINNVRKANAALAKDGKPTVSVFKQLATSIFSWQTALLVAVTAITLYGREIQQWISKTINAKKALDDLYNSTKNFNEIRKTSVADTQKERYELTILYKATQDVNLSKEQQLIAAQKLIDLYPETLANYTAEEILAGKAKSAIDELTTSLFKKAEADAILAKVGENNLKILDLQIKKREILAKEEAAKKGGFWNTLIDKNEWREWFGTTSEDVQNEINKIIELNKTLGESFNISDYLRDQSGESKATDKKSKTQKDDTLQRKKAKMELILAQRKLIVDAAKNYGTLTEAEQQEVEYLELKKKLLYVLSQFTKKGSKDEMDILKEVQEVDNEIANKRFEYKTEIDKNYSDSLSDRLKQWSEEEVSAIYSTENDKILARNKAATQEIANSRKRAKDILRIETQLGIDVLKIQYDARQAIIDSTLTTVEEKAKAAEEQKRIEEDLQKFLRDQSEKTEKQKREQLQKTFAIIKDLGNQAFEATSMFQDNAAQRAENRYAREVQMAGDAEDKKLSAQRRYESEKRKLERKAAIAQKSQAAFNIIIDTAQAIMKTLGETGFFGTPLALIVGALGAAQLAAVLSQPLPQFAEGTTDAPAKFIAGEQGAEAIITPSGKMILTPNEATVFNDKSFVGSSIIPHDETMKMLANRAMTQVHDIIDLSGTNSVLRNIEKNTGESVSYADGYKIVKRKNFTGRYRI